MQIVQSCLGALSVVWRTRRGASHRRPQQPRRRWLNFQTLEERLALAFTTIVNSGPSANRVDAVFLGDGYTSSDLTNVYPTHINNMLTHMFNEAEDPFPRYRNFFNVHRVDVVSQESGADVPPEGIFRNTALGASYFYRGGPDRLLYIDEALADAALNNNLSGSGFSAELKLVTVNESRYGGGGGNYAVYSGGNTVATEVALHELGHSFGNLADHYVDPGSGNYTGSEPSEPDVTKSSSGK